MKKVSIIVPVYKSEMFLDKLIKSILNQTYTNLELVLVDDGSPDNSGAICDKYAETDNRVVVIHKENGGCCDARNSGLAIVTGEYLMFADGDDWLELDCVEYLVSLMESNHCEMAMTDCIYTTRDRIQTEKDTVKVWTKEQAVCGIMYVEIPVGPWNKIYTTKIIKDNGLSFSVPWFGEGLYFSVMAAQYSNNIAVGHRKIYNYRLNNPNSGTTVRDVQHGLNSLQNSKYIKDQLLVKTNDTLHACDWHISRNYFNLIVFITGAKAKDEYLEDYKNAKNELSHSGMKVFRNSKISLKQKLIVLAISYFPDVLANIVLWNKKRKFKKDNMQ